MTDLRIYCTEDYKKQVKTAAVQKGVSVSDLLMEIVQRTIPQEDTCAEVFERDRGLKVSFRNMIDAIDRNNVKWAESKERRSNGNKKAWAKRKLGDSRTIEMPNDSFITLKGNIANMPATFDEIKDRTGITNYEGIRNFVEYCNLHSWCEPLGVLKEGYEEIL